MQLTRDSSLRDKVGTAVLELLRNGELAHGSRVIEEAIAERFQVSRTPVREALARLAQQGILERRRQGGYCVPRLTVKGIMDIMEVRELLEPAAMRAVAAVVTDRDLADLELAVKGQMEAAQKRNTKKFGKENDKFRTILFGAVSNDVLKKQIAQFDAHIHFMRAIISIDEESCGPMIKRQANLVQALKARDGEMASERWKDYLFHTREWLLAAAQASEAVPVEGA